jgi:hypothetical protein
VRAGDELILVGAAESGVTPLRVYASGEQFAAGIDGPEAQPVLELPAPPPLEAAKPTRGMVSTLKSWTVRT